MLSKARSEELRRPALRGNGRDPKQLDSTTGRKNTKPERHKPMRSSKGPRRTWERKEMEKLKCARSTINVRLSNWAALLGKMEGSKMAESSASNRGSMQLMPRTKAKKSSWLEERKNSKEFAFAKSGTDKEKPKCADDLMNTKSSKFVVSMTGKAKMLPARVKPTAGKVKPMRTRL